MNYKLLLLISFGITMSCSKNKEAENKPSEKKDAAINSTTVSEHFPPAGWKIVGSCATDFNNDTILDKAYVIEEDKETIPKEAECMGEPFHKKELLIKFGAKNGTETTNFKTSKVFGKCNWGIQGADAFDEIGNRKNTLKLSFSTGGTYRSSLSYYFRYQDNDWFLIGYEEVSYDISHEGQSVKEINYLTGKQDVYETLNGKNSKHEISNIKKSGLLKLDGLDISEHHNTIGEE
ncbi:hypothetical protein [Flavobacterium pedocola]